jgi:hypothetical protein
MAYVNRENYVLKFIYWRVGIIAIFEEWIESG